MFPVHGHGNLVGYDGVIRVCFYCKVVIDRTNIYIGGNLMNNRIPKGKSVGEMAA